MGGEYDRSTLYAYIKIALSSLKIILKRGG
jgi:hypothetical protein